MKKIYLLAMMLFSVNVLACVKAEIKDLAKADLWQKVKISPTGKYLSAITPVDGKNVLILFDALTQIQLHQFSFQRTAQPEDYHWVGDERLVIEKSYVKEKEKV